MRDNPTLNSAQIDRITMSFSTATKMCGHDSPHIHTLSLCVNTACC